MVEATRASPLLRYDLPCTALGLGPPPSPVQLRFLGDAAACTILAFVPAGCAQAGARWLEDQTGAPATYAPGLAPRKITSTLAPPPPEWSWLDPAVVLQVDLIPSGTATLFVLGANNPLVHLTQPAEPLAWRHRPAALHKGECILTGKQREVLRVAVALGYYDIPHRIDLRDLGKTMGLSLAAVSQLLRRAQARIVRGHMDADTLEQCQFMAPESHDFDYDAHAGHTENIHAEHDP